MMGIYCQILRALISVFVLVACGYHEVKSQTGQCHDRNGNCLEAESRDFLLSLPRLNAVKVSQHYLNILLSFSQFKT